MYSQTQKKIQVLAVVLKFSAAVLKSPAAVHKSPAVVLKLAAAVLKFKAIQYQKKLLIYFLRNMFTTMTYARQNVLKVLSLFVLVLLKKKTKKPTSCNIAGLRIRRCHTVKQQTYGGQFSQKERVYIVTFVENMILWTPKIKQRFSTKIQVRESVQRHSLIIVKLYNIKMLFPQKCCKSLFFSKGNIGKREGSWWSSCESVWNCKLDY